MSELNYIVELVNGENYHYKGVHYMKDVPVMADKETADYLSQCRYQFNTDRGRMEVEYFFVEELSSEEEAQEIVSEWQAEQKEEERANDSEQVIDTIKAVSKRKIKQTDSADRESTLIQRAKSSRVSRKSETPPPDGSISDNPM